VYTYQLRQVKIKIWKGRQMRFSDWLYKVSNGWVTLSAVIVFFLFSALVLPGQSSSASVDPAVGSPDLSIYYSAGDLLRMAEAYGEQGREEYIRARFTFDLVWPLVYTFFLATTISWTYNRLGAGAIKWRTINLLPVLGMLGDYLENIATSLVMWQYPQDIPLVAWLAGIFTVLKWLLIAGSFISLVVGVILLLWQVLIKRRRSAT
jgi:hypothetical protein